MNRLYIIVITIIVMGILVNMSCRSKSNDEDANTLPDKEQTSSQNASQLDNENNEQSPAKFAKNQASEVEIPDGAIIPTVDQLIEIEVDYELAHKNNDLNSFIDKHREMLKYWYDTPEEINLNNITDEEQKQKILKMQENKQWEKAWFKFLAAMKNIVSENLKMKQEYREKFSIRRTEIIKQNKNSE